MDGASAAKLQINCLRINFQAEKEQCEAYTVPLPAQVVALLRSIYPLTRHGLNVFPGELSHNRLASDSCGAQVLCMHWILVSPRFIVRLFSHCNTAITHTIVGIASLVNTAVEHNRNSPRSRSLRNQT